MIDTHEEGPAGADNTNGAGCEDATSTKFFQRSGYQPSAGVAPYIRHRTVH